MSKKTTLILLPIISVFLLILSLAYFIFYYDYQIGGAYYTQGVGSGNYTTIIQKESLFQYISLNKVELFAKKKVSITFTGKSNNLGIIAIPFETNNRSVNDKVVFRLKESGKKEWYQKATYNTNQFQSNAPFPFGFPVIKDSKNKSYTFEIESLSGTRENHVSINSADKYFFTKYKFSKSELISSRSSLLRFLGLKINSVLSVITFKEVFFIFIVTFSPCLFFFRKKILEKLLTIRMKNPFLQTLNLKKYLFYLGSASSILIFFLNGLITRGNNFYNIFFIPSQNDSFMDFYNVLYSTFYGPYSQNSIYPPFPLMIFRFMLRLVPYNIAAEGPSVIRASQSGQIVFLFYLLITLFMFFVLIMEIKKGLRLEKYLFTFLILLSGPFLFQFERANIIFLALLFLIIFVFFKDSKNRLVREFALLSLAISAGIKIYPAVFVILLLKEKRFKESLRVLLYGLALFIFPFFTIGGINQLPILIKNVFLTTDETTKWGFGYMVNVQNTVRIFFGFLGNFSDKVIIIGRALSLIVLVLGLVMAFVTKIRWKALAILTILMVVVPSVSYEYTLIFMLIPLIVFLDREEKENRIDYLYLFCFFLIFMPFSFGGIDILNNAFRQKQFLPITYGVLFQSITILFMFGLLVYEEWFGGRLKTTKVFLKTIVLKISNKLSKFDKYYWVIPVSVIALYNLIFFNKYYPITEGWFSTYSWLMSQGQFPYKDFYFFMTPLYLVIINIFTTIFGYSILYLRIFGIGAILLMTYFLYKNLQIIFGSAIAAFVSIVGIIYYQSGVAHITYDFTQFVTLFGLIQLYFLLKYINVSTVSDRKIKWIFIAGLFAGFAFLTKQSNGMMIALFSFAGLIILSLPKGKREFLRVSSAYISGFTAPFLVTIFWLLSNSAFVQFKDQVFSSAVAAKGGLGQIFFGWFKEVFNYDFLARAKEIFIIFFVFGYWLYFFRLKKKEEVEINYLLLPFVSLILFILVLLPLFGHINWIYMFSRFGQMGIGNISVIAVSLSLILAIIGVVFYVLKRPFNKALILLSFVSLGFIYGNGTSAGLSEAGVFIGFCIFVSLMLYCRSFLNLGKIFIILFCLSFTLNWVEIKYERPYYWWNATSADIRGNIRSTEKIQMLKGMYTSSENMKLIEEVTAEIISGSKPGDSILTFPNIPGFYLYGGRKLPGKAIVYWFDFLPDALAQKEAEEIRKNPPKVIVYLDLGSSVWEAHETLFRDGKPSGQRKIVEAFMYVVKSKKMHISKQYELANGVTLKVWRN